MFARRILTTTPVVALMALSAATADALPQTGALVATKTTQAELHESRWLPWLGCWELTADAVDYRQVEDTGRRVVCIAPRLDGAGVNLTTYLDSTVIAENTVVADGRERPLPEADCSGSQTATWSSDGRRLHSSVNATCATEGRRALLGLSMLAEGDRWMELQSVSVGDTGHRELLVRQYQRLGADATQELGFEPITGSLAVSAATARAGAAAPLDVDAVIEAVDAFPVEMVEAAILESHSAFALDTDALIRLADADIDERVIDLMVAVSFPDEFVVDNGSSGGGGGYGDGGGYGYVGFGSLGYSSYYSGSCWGAYYSPFYGPYGPRCDPWYYGYYAPGYRYGPGGGGSIGIRVPPSGSLYGGKVINDRGYATVSSGPEPTPLPGDGVSGAIRRVFRRDGSAVSGGGGSSGSSGSSSRRSGSVSRRGFSKGNSGGSSGGSSGTSSSSKSGSAKRKAKPKPKGGSGG